MKHTPAPSRPRRFATALRAVLLRGLVFGGLWAVLVGFRAEMLVFGVLVVPAVLGLSLALLPPGQIARSGVSVPGLIRRVPGFFLGSLKGGLLLGWRLVQPRMALNPGWTMVPLRARGPARVGYGAALSLMPGTLAAGAHRGRLLVHRLDGAPARPRARPAP